MFCLLPVVWGLFELQKKGATSSKRMKKLLALLISGPVVLELTACFARKDMMLLVVATLLTLEKLPSSILKHLLAATKLVSDSVNYVYMIASSSP
tara:strand:+ start:187 stop:471 length:285 start_codon:yes stop_codon:yes gene_type:complete